jgi:hypothetical protein
LPDDHDPVLDPVTADDPVGDVVDHGGVDLAHVQAVRVAVGREPVECPHRLFARVAADLVRALEEGLPLLLVLVGVLVVAGDDQVGVHGDVRLHPGAVPGAVAPAAVVVVLS